MNFLSIKSGSRNLVLLGFLLFLGSCRTVKVFTDNNLKISNETHIGFLPSTISESSGLETISGDSLLTFNDSGGQACLYILSPLTPEKPRKIVIDNAQNVDWEDIAFDGSNLYVGDIGNNFGNRDTLIVYKFSSGDMEKATLSSSTISFTILEKGPEYSGVRGNPYDCEAMAVINDSLWVFTKNWQNKTTSVYKLPLQPGHYDLSAETELNPRMLVTGADYCKESNLLILSGYKLYIPRIKAYSIHDGKFQPSFKINYFNHPGLQTEGIVVGKANTVFFSNEKSIKKQGLFKFTIRGL